MNTTPDEGLKLASQVVHLAQDESISNILIHLAQDESISDTRHYYVRTFTRT